MGTRRNGKWPTWAHHKLIEEAFKDDPQYAAKINTLKSWSDYSDKSEFQTPEYSFRHAMGVKGETKLETINKINLFLNSEYSTDEVEDFGVKLHTIMDMTSPMHEGYQSWGEVVEIDPWGAPVYNNPNILTEVLHGLGEMNPSFLENKATIRLMQEFKVDYANKSEKNIEKYRTLYNQFLFQETVNYEMDRFNAAYR